MPQAVYSFFDEYDLAGKTIIDDGFTVAANRVTTAEDDVTAWAEKHELTYSNPTI